MDEAKNPVWMAVWPTLLVVGFGLACGGGGATFGENSPGNAAYGGGTYLDDARVRSAEVGQGDNGSLAVDPDTEYTYTLQVRNLADENTKRLVAIPPDGPAHEVMDLTGFEDIRILFPQDSVLVMAQPQDTEEAIESGRCFRPEEARVSGCADHLFWFDKSARTRLRQKQTRSRYHGTRLSAKRNYLAVADNFIDGENLHLLDTSTGATNVIPNSAGWFEAQWMREEDVLVSASFGREAIRLDGSSRVIGDLRISEWSPRNDHESAAERDSTCFYDEEVSDAPTDCDVVIPGIKAIWFGGFSWIGVSPDDRWVAVPARRESGHAIVVLVDREGNDVHVLEDTYGPVGFTPDSKTLIGFGFEDPYIPQNVIDSALSDQGDDPFLAIVDLETMEITKEPTPGDDEPTFFVSRDSADVVVASAWGERRMIIVDLDEGTTEQMPGLEVARAGRAIDLASDPTSPEYSADRRTLSANNLIAQRSVIPRVEECHDRVCEADVTVYLNEFVSRTGERELWLIEPHGLMRIDLEGGYAERVEMSPQPEHINILPKLDRLVLDAPGLMAIRFFDPSRRRVEHTTSIELGWEPL